MFSSHQLIPLYAQQFCSDLSSLKPSSPYSSSSLWCNRPVGNARRQGRARQPAPADSARQSHRLGTYPPLHGLPTGFKTKSFNITLCILRQFVLQYRISARRWHTYCHPSVNPLTPNDPYSGRTAPLTSKQYILYIYSTNIGTECFKHGIYSPSFSSSKCNLFHNSNIWFLYYSHFIYRCAKI